MKKSMLLAMCLSVSVLANWGGDSAFAQSSSATASFDKDGKTLTITGNGDLSTITVTDTETKVFSATGAGKVYTKTTTGEGDDATTTATAVKAGDVYNSETQYYETVFSYGEAITPSTDYNTNYTMTTAFTLTLGEGESIHAIYWGDNGATANITLTASDTQSVGNFNNWDKKDASGYYYWCIFKGTVPSDFTGYSNTIAMSEFKDGVYTNGDFTITLLNDDNRSTYGGNKSTIKASVDNLYYSSDATNYTWLAKDATVEYTDGMKLYLATTTVSDEAIADNATYFGETHSDYITNAVLSFVDYLPVVIGSDINTVIIKSEKDGQAKLTNAIMRALVKIESIETLNLQDTYLESLNTYAPSKYNAGYGDPTFFVGEPTGNYNPATNSSLKTLYMPATGTKMISEVTDDNNTYRLFQYLQGLKELHLSEGIETLGENAISNVGQSNLPYLTTLIFPNTLKTAKAYCMNGQSGVLTLTFPKGMETIERHAFWGSNPKDVYFLDTKAPKVAAHAWGESNYISNNAMTNKVKVGDTEETSIEVDKQTGVAVRQNYETQNGWYAMLHYPAACTKAEAARYTDLTRSYKKIVYGVEDETFKVKKNSSDDGTAGIEYYYYEAGKETEGLKGKGENNDANILSNITASTFFQNRYPTTSNSPYGGDYTGGYEDYYVGSQYIWPSMNQSQRACIVAENGVLWDGVTTIGAGISKYDSEYTNNGSEYIGLHQFVFAQGDVQTDKTDEWDVTKYADGKWHSICLPFHVTKAKMKETFGPNEKGEYNFRVCKFHKVDRTDEKLKLYFNDEYFTNAKDEDVVLTAHVSYMIKAKKENMVEGEKVMLKNYVLEAGSPVPTNVTVNAKSSGSEGETEANQYYFIGQYNSGVTIPQYSYFFSKNKGYFRFQAGTNAKWNGYTSVVEAPNGKDDYQKYFNGTTDSDAKLSTIWDEDETTGIDNVTIIAGDEVVYTSDNVYNLSGQLVSTKGMNGLAKGIYIQNGKKYIVK